MKKIVSNYQHGLATGYFHIDQYVVPYDFIDYIRCNFDPETFGSEPVLSMDEVFDKNFLNTLSENKLLILPACLAIIASHQII